MHDLQLYFNPVRAFDERACTLLGTSCHADTATPVDTYADCNYLQDIQKYFFTADELSLMPLGSRPGELAPKPVPRLAAASASIATAADDGTAPARPIWGMPR